MNDTTIDICGVPVRLWRGGTGPVMLLLSGAGGPEMMLPLARDLGAGFDVVLPEHPGFGAADAPDWLERVADLAYIYAELLEVLGVRDVVLVGHSLGGWIAAEMAVRSTARLASLNLISAGGVTAPGAPAADNFLWSRAETARRFFHDPVHAEAFLAKPMDEGAMVRAIKRQHLVAKLVWKPRWHSPELQKWLRRIKIPTRIIWGENDALFPLAHARVYYDQIATARLCIIPDCGHLPFLERPQAFKDCLFKCLGERS